MLKKRQPTENQPHFRLGPFILPVIFLLALGLRLWGSNFGLPYPYHFDEPFYVTDALNLGKGEFEDIWTPAGLVNMLFSEYAALYVFGRLANIFTSLADFENLYRNDPTIFFLLGRWSSALLGSLTVLVVYGIGVLLFSRRVALVAACFMAFSFLHVRDSHFSVPDVPVTFFIALSVYLCLSATKKKSTWGLIFAAVAAGVAITFKWTAWPVSFAIFLAIIDLALKPGNQTKIPSKHFWKRVFRLSFLAGLALVGSFAITSLQFFLKPEEFIRFFFIQLESGEMGGYSIWVIDTLPGWLFYLKTLGYGLGWGLLVISCLASGLTIYQAIRNKNMDYWILIAFPLIYFLVMGATKHYFARYTIPLIPFLVIFSAHGLVWVTNRLFKENHKLATTSLVVLSALLIFQPMISSIRVNQLFSRLDTRTQAKEWIEANIPDGSKIAIDAIILTPPLSTPENVVPNSKRTYHVSQPRFRGLFAESADSFFTENDFDYLIASSFIYNIPVLDGTQAEREIFYQSLDEKFVLVKEFYPNDDLVEPAHVFDEMFAPIISLWQRDFPGPVLKIYAVKSQ
jgi:4-amino-4-deoxy-L-arabinose transferase-like glycosyltransferase